MPDTLQDIHGTPVLLCAPTGPPLRAEQDALDLIANAHHLQAQWVALPTTRLTDDFFHLHTRLAGTILQKFVNYGLGLAILGDVSQHAATNPALRALIHETNRGRHAWFLPTVTDLHTRLAR